VRDTTRRYVHEIGQKPVLVRVILTGLPETLTRRCGIQRNRAAGQLGWAWPVERRSSARIRARISSNERAWRHSRRTGVETLHLGRPAIARGEDQHRHRPPLRRMLQHEMPSIFGRRYRARPRRKARCREEIALPRRRRRGRHITGIRSAPSSLTVKIGIVSTTSRRKLVSEVKRQYPPSHAPRRRERAMNKVRIECDFFFKASLRFSGVQPAGRRWLLDYSADLNA